MEAKCASTWSEESEMIAHLQCMFWSSSDANAGISSSPNSSTSSCLEPSTLPTSSFLPLTENEFYDMVPLENTGEGWCFGHQSQAFAATTNAATGDKRILLTDESRRQSKNTKKPRTIAPVSRTLSSRALYDESNTELINRCSSWSCSSEEESIGMCEQTAVLKQSDRSRGRSRSSKNSQSLYAKKRRERINEKLKILQQLIPNGTKVDISTMLEEAVQYVKFLQLQIKLLSSEETWMYAPLAYNHMSIDLSLSAAAHQS